MPNLQKGNDENRENFAEAEVEVLLNLHNIVQQCIQGNQSI